MLRITVDPARLDGRALAPAVDALRADRVVAFPTETVYGLGALALSVRAVQRIFDIKGRPQWNPLIVHVRDAAMAQACVVAQWSPLADALAQRFWPGPLTLVLPKQPSVPEQVTAGLPTVAVRAPSHPVARALIDGVQAPVAAPSANRFMGISPTQAAHVEKSLGQGVDVLVDGGPCAVGVESTVLDLTGPFPRVLRAGGVSLAEISAVAPHVMPYHRAAGVGSPLPSPGMAARHYAPKSTLHLVPHGDEVLWQRALKEAAEPVGTLSFTLPASSNFHRSLALDPFAAQAALYAALHGLEDAGCAAIVVEGPPAGAAWDAIRDRLSRAATHA
jgi:L-threonylcarbamoyladenylate synthase